MSYNLVDPTTGELTQVAGSIDTSIIPSDASATNKLATESNLNSKGVFKGYTEPNKKTNSLKYKFMKVNYLNFKGCYLSCQFKNCCFRQFLFLYSTDKLFPSIRTRLNYKIRLY